MTTELYSLPVDIQVALGGGYLAYVTAYGGLRRGHDAAHVVFITFAFGIIATLVLVVLPSEWGVWRILAAIYCAVFGGAVWRVRVKGWVQNALSFLDVHHDDGIEDSWGAYRDAVGVDSVTQVSVHTADGRVLYCNDLSKFQDWPMKGFCLGTDGGIALPVEEEELPDGREEQRDGLDDADWGQRFTYVPPHAVSRVNLRIKKEIGLFFWWWSAGRRLCTRRSASRAGRLSLADGASFVGFVAHCGFSLVLAFVSALRPVFHCPSLPDREGGALRTMKIDRSRSYSLSPSSSG